MKIVIPSMDDGGMDAAVSGHFGQAPFFTLVDTEAKTALAAASGGHQEDRTPVDTVLELGAEVVLCSGMGRRAMAVLEEEKIAVFVGAEGTVREAIAAYEQGRLEAASEDAACAGHH